MMHSAPANLSPRQKIALVRDPDMMTVSTEAKPYKLYPFHGLQQSPTKSHVKKLKHIENTAPTHGKCNDAQWYPLARPFSPLSPVSPTSVVQHLANEPHPAVKPTDLDKIEAWLKSLESEAQHFTSYFLFCEMKFQQTSVLASGREMPNRLRTAVAFYCLQQASSIFGRYQSVLDTICLNLGSAIYSTFTGLRRGNPLTALECYQAGLTYFEQCHTLQAQNQELKQSKADVDSQLIRLKQQVAQLEAHNQQLRQRTSALGTLSAGIKHLGTHGDKNDTLTSMVATFQDLDMGDKMQLISGMIEGLGSDINIDALLTLIDNLAPHERKRLLDLLFQDHAQTMRAEIKAEISVEEITRRNEEEEEYRLRHEKYQSYILDVLNGTSLSELDIPNGDKETMEALARVVDALSREKDRVVKLEARIFALNASRSKARRNIESSAQDRQAEFENIIANLESEKKALEDTLNSLKAQEIERAKRLNLHDVATQVNKGEIQTQLQPGKERKISMTNDGTSTWLEMSYAPKVNKRFPGLYTMIQDADYSVANVKRILAKKRPLSMIEMNQTIAGLYQSKMCQDISDDNMHRHREGLSQMLLDAYTVYYGLKELAMGQLIHLDTAVQRYASKSSRIRLFGLMVGSLEPGSFASSAQAIDFFLFVVGVIFNVGNYRLNEDKAMANVKQLKTLFGDGIVGSPHSTTIRLEKLVQTVQTVFAYNTISVKFLEELSALQNAQGEVDLDLALEKIMFHWLHYYSEQIETMRKVFSMADKDGNGVLDFQEFSIIVRHLDPNCLQRECLALYNQVAGADNVIDQEEFVIGMILHQRDLMLESYFATPQATTNSVSRPFTSKKDSLTSPNATQDIVEKLTKNKQDIAPFSLDITDRISSLLEMLNQSKANGLTQEATSPRVSVDRDMGLQWDAHIDDVVTHFMSNTELERKRTSGR